MKTAESQFTTISGVGVEPVYGPEHIPDLEFGAPGEFPPRARAGRRPRSARGGAYRGKSWGSRPLLSQGFERMPDQGDRPLRVAHVQVYHDVQHASAIQIPLR